MVLTITTEWQNIINKSGIDPTPRMDIPVEPKILDALRKNFPDFVKAYEPDGLKPEEFADYGSFTHTLNQFLGGYAGLLDTIRGFMIQVK